MCTQKDDPHLCVCIYIHVCVCVCVCVCAQKISDDPYLRALGGASVWFVALVCPPHLSDEKGTN